MPTAFTAVEQSWYDPSLAPHHVEHEAGNHDMCDPDECFAAKCAYWRTNGAFGLAIPEGWRGPSIRVREAEAVAEARSNGYEPERVR